MQAADYAEKPFLVIWEMTHACDLACVHCRASAEPYPAPDELTTDEAKRLIDQVHEMGTRIFVFSGGDPLKRADLTELIRHAKTLRLRTGAIPAVTPALTRARIEELHACGLDQIAFSLDAAQPAAHDAFRRAEGVFERTIASVKIANELGMAVQINSLINLHNLETMDELIVLMKELNIVFWEVFFLVPVGRGEELALMEAGQFDAAFARLYELSQRASFIIKVTEAPHYRRFYIQRQIERHGLIPREVETQSVELPQYLTRTTGPRGSIGRAPVGVNAGKGFIFVSCRGEVFPSGFLPLVAGDIRQQSLGDIYRTSPLLQELRDTNQLKGRCGLCPYRDVCGGSRSRAYALTGDYMAEDPSCSYQPVSAITN